MAGTLLLDDDRLIGHREPTPSEGRGWSRNFEKGGNGDQPCRHLSQMHTTNCMPFIRKKAAYWKNLGHLYIHLLFTTNG